MGSGTTALGDPAREAQPGDHGGAMATSGSHRAQPFGGLGRRERRRTKRDPGERCQGAAARATPCVAGVPPISGTRRPQGRLPRLGLLGLRVGEESASSLSPIHDGDLKPLVRPLHQLAHKLPSLA